MSVCLHVCLLSNFFKLLLNFFPILTKLGTHDLRANIQKKNCATDFRNIAFIIFGALFIYFFSNLILVKLGAEYFR